MIIEAKKKLTNILCLSHLKSGIFTSNLSTINKGQEFTIISLNIDVLQIKDEKNGKIYFIHEDRFKEHFIITKLK